MKILQVNKFYYPKRGADKYFFFIADLLRAHGHEVRVFAMDSPENLSSTEAAYFSKHIDLHARGLLAQLRTAAAILYNREAKKKFTELLADFRPDIIHCHNIYHQLSPSILDAARKANIPVVLHLHDYKLICPNYKLYTHGQACRRCRPQKYGQCCHYRCVENSRLKSALAALEMTLHHRWLKIYRRGVNLFIAPSEFIKKTCLDFGWPEAQFRVLENISPVSRIDNEPFQDYFLYFGALEEEKGVDLLIRAAAKSGRRVKIAGSGRELAALKQLNLSLGAPAEFLGQLQGITLQKTIAAALAIVVPSRWPENMPLAVIEAMGLGKFVIGADIGGLSELLIPGKTGALFPPNDWKTLSELMSKTETEFAETIGREAAASRQDKNEDWHYRQLLKIYQEAIKKRAS